MRKGKRTGGEAKREEIVRREVELRIIHATLSKSNRTHSNIIRRRDERKGLERGRVTGTDIQIYRHRTGGIVIGSRQIGMRIGSRSNRFYFFTDTCKFIRFTK